MNSIYRNRRTANGLKRGVRVEWDTPKQKPKAKDKFDAVKFLSGCANDKEAYSDKERSGFRKVIERIQELEAEVAAHMDSSWDNGG